MVAWRSGAGDRAVGVSFGFSGELVGVEGRAADGEPCLMEPGRPKGDWRDPRALLKKRGDGFESEGADCSVLAWDGAKGEGRREERRLHAYHDVVSLVGALRDRSIGQHGQHGQ